MDTENEKKCIFNVRLAKRLALYQILNPSTTTIYNYNVFYLIIICIVVYIFTIVISLVSSLYYIMNDIIQFSVCLGYTENFSFSCFKTINILYYSKDIWKFMSATSFKCMAYQHYNVQIFENWRNRSIRITNAHVLMLYTIVIYWISIPCLSNTTTIEVRQLDGSYGKYRNNVYNMFLMVPDNKYNDQYVVFVFLETLTIIGYTYFLTVFDILMLTMTFAFACQLEAINDAISSLGYRVYKKDDEETYDNSARMNEVNHDKVHDDLKTILIDHQNIIKQMRDFYKKFRSILLVQIFVISSTQIVILLIVSLYLAQGNIAGNKTLIKLAVTLPFFTLQLLMSCYLFGFIHETKDSIIFALYSSNWTDMNIKTKKLILYAMKMNNTDNFKLKFTQIKIVNLEMFSNTMRICYSLLSMLLKFSLKKME